MDAKEAIRLQFMTQYAQKDFTDITVKGLCAAAPVARTTFYSYYNNTDDVRQEIEDDLIRGLLEISDMIAAGNYPDMDFSIFLQKCTEMPWSINPTASGLRSPRIPAMA